MRWVTVKWAAAALEVSRQRVYQLIESGSLVSIKQMYTVLVSARSVDARIALLEKEGGKAHVGR